MRKKTMKNDELEQTKKPDAIKRIGQQVSSLIMPDFRTLSKLLQDQIRGTAEQRNKIARQIEQAQSEAMAAATQLMLIGDNNWQQRPASHMHRVKKLTGETYE